MLYCLTTMEYDPLLYLGIVESDLSESAVATRSLDSEELTAPQGTINHQEEAIVAADKRQRRGAVAPKIARVASAGTVPHQNPPVSRALPETQNTDTAGIDWRLRAACAREDPELFFTPGDNFSPKQAELAKAICRQCTVVDQCLKYALKTDDKFAILGGTTPEERRAIRQRHVV